MTDAPGRIRQTIAVVCLAVAGVGVLAALGGAVWQRAAHPRHVWTVEQSQEYDAANAALHAATVGHDHETNGAEAVDAHQADLAAAQERFNRINAELQAARYAKDRLGTALIRGGLAAAALGGVGYLATRNG
jgi:hypothetical protein